LDAAVFAQSSVQRQESHVQLRVAKALGRVGLARSAKLDPHDVVACILERLGYRVSAAKRDFTLR
jgi:hypothetical protein